MDEVALQFRFSSQQEDALLGFLLDIEHQQSSFPSKSMDESPQFYDSPHIGIFRIKTEPSVSIYELFENPSLLNSLKTPVIYSIT